jgi:hypothetical protein
MDANNKFFMRKFAEAVGLICIALAFQTIEQFTVSALLMGLAWQQLGWMIHEVIKTDKYIQNFNFSSMVINSISK